MELASYFEFIGNDAIRNVGIRVGTETVLWAYQEGANPEEVVLRYPTLSLSLERIHASISRYLANREGNRTVLSACERAVGKDVGGSTTPTL